MAFQEEQASTVYTLLSAPSMVLLCTFPALQSGIWPHLATISKRKKRILLESTFVLTPDLVSSVLLGLLGLEPVFDGGGTGSASGGISALNLDSHALILLEAAGEISLLGGQGGLGDVEDLNVGIGIALLDDGSLVGL